MGDIVEPKGLSFKLPIALLWQHDSSQPIGWVKSARVSRSGIEIEGEVADIADVGSLKSRIDEAWQAIKAGLVRGLSIGFRPLEAEPLNPKEPWGAVRFLKAEWLELSAVTIPANQDASITAIKSAFAKSGAVPGRIPSTQRTSPAGASAHSKGNAMEPLHTQIESIKNGIAEKTARMEELLKLKGEGKFDETARSEFDTLKTEIGDDNDELSLKEVQFAQSRTAVPVDKKSAQGGRAPYGFVRKQDPEDKFQGESEMRRLLCKVQATIDAKNGDFRRPWEIAEERFGKTHPNLVAVMKTGVAGGGSGSGESLAEFVSADNRYTGDFIDYLYKQTVFDRLPLREVPANVAIKGLDGAWTAYFVGESKGIPASQGSGSSTSTTPLKVAALTVLSNELIRDSSPSALLMARDGLSEAHRQKVDTLFLSATAASAGVSPAGILNGVSALPTAGNTAANALTDIGSLEDVFTLADFEGDLVLVMRKTMGGALGRMRSTLGIYDFPGLSRDGGQLDGKTVYTGGNVGAGDVIMLAPSEIWKIGDLGVSISVSQEAMIEQDTAPQGATDTPVAASATMVSMFQEESTAIKLVRPINWGKRRTFAAQYIGNATYGDATT
ncbi:MAG TPA: phage major capsid protein [Polyangiaceae bacterium]|nr:phage major capsid protein [Polyangiaceae bacterium]